MNVGSHVSGAGDGKDFAVAIEEMIVDSQRLATREQLLVVKPKPGVVFKEVRRAIDLRLEREPRFDRVKPRDE